MRSDSADRFLQRVWYQNAGRLVSFLLLPLSWLFAALVWLRRMCFRAGVLRSHGFDVPVIVVGNVTVGGTGKTPFTIWLARRLHERGLKVGIVLRGYGGASREWPRHVTPQTAWQDVGDEAILLARSTSALVIAGPDRVADVRRAIELGAQVVVSDDGLQHYRLQRDAEIIVVDGERGIGNARMLPAGPLREPRTRIMEADLQVVTRRAPADASLPAAFGTSMAVVAVARISYARSLSSGQERPLSEFVGTAVHAIAAIGHPEAFFGALRRLGLTIREHPYPDHAALRREDLVFADDAPVLMTEKDAVKCTGLFDERHWVVPLELELSPADTEVVSGLLDRVLGKAR